MNINDKIYSSKALSGRVVRYHSWPVIHEQSTGEHSQRVITIYVELWGLPRAEVLYYCTVHDQGELWAGDSPFAAKRGVPELKEATNKAEKIGLEKLGIKLPELTEDEFVKFKIADILEMHEYGLIEKFMGNRFAIPIVEKTSEAIENVANGYSAYKIKADIWMGKAYEHFNGI